MEFLHPKLSHNIYTNYKLKIYSIGNIGLIMSSYHYQWDSEVNYTNIEKYCYYFTFICSFNKNTFTSTWKNIILQHTIHKTVCFYCRHRHDMRLQLGASPHGNLSTTGKFHELYFFQKYKTTAFQKGKEGRKPTCPFPSFLPEDRSTIQLLKCCSFII